MCGASYFSFKVECHITHCLSIAKVIFSRRNQFTRKKNSKPVRLIHAYVCKHAIQARAKTQFTQRTHSFRMDAFDGRSPNVIKPVNGRSVERIQSTQPEKLMTANTHTHACQSDNRTTSYQFFLISFINAEQSLKMVSVKKFEKIPTIIGHPCEIPAKLSTFKGFSSFLHKRFRKFVRILAKNNFKWKPSNRTMASECSDDCLVRIGNVSMDFDRLVIKFFVAFSSFFFR